MTKLHNKQVSKALCPGTEVYIGVLVLEQEVSYLLLVRQLICWYLSLNWTGQRMTYQLGMHYEMWHVAASTMMNMTDLLLASSSNIDMLQKTCKKKRNGIIKDCETAVK